MKFLKTLLPFVLAMAFLALGVRLYYKLTDDFHYANIVFDTPPHEEWKVKLSPDERNTLNEIIDQPFTYLGKGAQSYVFESADGNYVVKFFKFKHLKPSLFLSMLPSVGPIHEFKEKNRARKEKKLRAVFNGHHLGYHLAKEGSGLLYVHLQPTGNLCMQMHVKDKIGLPWTIPLDRVIFVLQKKGETLDHLFRNLLDQGKLDVVVKKAGQVLDMYLLEYNKGLWDRDHGISHNIGFLGEDPFHLDVGKLDFDPEIDNAETYEKDFHYVASQMYDWMETYYPDYAESFKSSLAPEVEDKLFRFSLSKNLSPMWDAATP